MFEKQIVSPDGGDIEAHLASLSKNVLYDHGYSRPVSEERLIELRHQLTELDLETRRVEEEKKEVVQSFAAKIKPLKKKSESLMDDIETKMEHVKDTVYEVFNYETGLVGQYDSSGALLGERTLRDEEKQLTIGTIDGAIHDDMCLPEDDFAEEK